MGNRVTIEMNSVEFESNLLIYSHWMGDSALIAIQDVLSTTTRIGDASYLAAQIFHRFATAGGYDGNMGFGLSTGTNGDSWDDMPTHFVDLDRGYYSVGGDVWFDRWGKELGADNE
jgi:hypothetical protein